MFEQIFDVVQAVLVDPVVDGALGGVPGRRGGAELQQQRDHRAHVEDGRQEERRPPVRPARTVDVRPILKEKKNSLILEYCEG